MTWLKNPERIYNNLEIKTPQKLPAVRFLAPEFLTHLCARFLADCLRIFPLSLTPVIAARIGDLIYCFASSRRVIARRNVSYAFANSLPAARKEQIVRHAFQNAAIAVAELYLMPKMLGEAHSRFRLTGNEHLEKAFAQGNGVILAISHLGSWEYLGFLPYLTKRKWSVVVRDIRNPYIDKEINALRRVTSLNPIPKKESVREIIKELKQNHGVAILTDQWAGPEGLWLEFFGEPTSTTSIPARLALRFKSPIVPAYCLRQSPGFYSIEIHEPVPAKSGDEIEITKRLDALLETQIRKYPDQWIWAHRRWKPKPRTIRNVAYPR